MSRALVTFATGDHKQLLDLALPGFARYAKRHGYTLVTRSPSLLLRPASWYKIPALLDALDHFDEALWLDCDIAIVDDTLDLAAEAPAGAWQALVRHHTSDGEVPNGGVWYVRQPARPALEAVWRSHEYLVHPWWEQAALLGLLGYQLAPARLLEPTVLYDRTHWLGLEWNSHEQNDRHPEPRFAHATCGTVEWRAAVMRGHVERSPSWASTS